MTRVHSVVFAYLIDPDSYASGSSILLEGPPKLDRLKDKGQTK